MIVKPTKAALLLALFIPALASADGVGQCKVIHWKPNHVYTLLGSINFATHLTMSTDAAATPVVGNSDRTDPNGLWHVEYIPKQNNVFFKPTDASSNDGAETSMTYLGANGHSYEFRLKRSDSVKYTCVVVLDDGALMDNSWSRLDTNNSRLVEILSAKLKQEKKDKDKEAQSIVSQQRKALELYRSHIFTDYNWDGRNLWWGKKNISSVYDDGRWTYVRVKKDLKGVMSLYGMVNGKKEMLEYKYDSQNHIYRISNVYPKLVMVYDNKTIDITRNS